jgi:hypothetical protein
VQVGQKGEGAPFNLLVNDYHYLRWSRSLKSCAEGKLLKRLSQEIETG